MKPKIETFATLGIGGVMADPRMTAMEHAMGADFMGWTEREKTCFTLGWERAIEAARSAVPAQASAPDAVTPEMIAAAEAVDDLYRRGTPETWGKVYRAMRAAAPL